ncbi:MAG TPA: NUDIX domain-containing protein [Gemmatimonadales bacterium]|nr:NUDIX domain-containing protein [Gemmatimonadales bacterium]
MTTPPTRVAYVDVLVLRGRADELEVLCLRRGPGGRSPGSWEGVHAHIDPGETPVETALRELLEETGLRPLKLYNLSRVESFYRHSSNEVVLVPVFAAFVARDAAVKLSEEHDEYEWLRPQAARSRVSWPRIRREIGFAMRLIGLGDGGPVEDVLRIL